MEKSTNVYGTRRTYEKSTKLKKVKNVTIILFLLVFVSINAFICDNKPPQGHPGGPGLKEVLGKSKNCELFYFFVSKMKVQSKK
jgi:hypothetical protein